MPNSYGDRERIPELKGRVRGGLAVVAHSPADLVGIQRLVTSVDALPGDTLRNLYRVVADAGATLDRWPGFAGTMPVTQGEPSATKYDVDRESAYVADPKVQALQAALTLAAQTWSKQRAPDELACALLLPRRAGRRVAFETKRPSLTLDYGSLRARVLDAGGVVRAFGVSLFPVARSRRQIDLVEAMAAGAQGTRLPGIESLRPSDVESKSAVVIFLHGLLSIDVGTFDEFIAALQKRDPRRAMLLVAWRHDTLDSIKLNAEQLAREIQTKLGGSSLPIAFVCHSRGGLVARRAIVELLKNEPRWSARLRATVTYGTPHEGAELAEKADGFLGKWLLLHTVHQRGGYAPLFDALWTVREFGTLPGITDLRPAKNGGKFLRRLEKAEGRLAGGRGTFPVPLFAVGGHAVGRGLSGWMARRFFRDIPNDLIVTLSSSTPEHVQPNVATTSDHFGYFANEEIRKKHTVEALDFLQRALRPEAVAGRHPFARQAPTQPGDVHRARVGAVVSPRRPGARSHRQRKLSKDFGSSDLNA
jgi:hypothetical protein